MQGLHEAGCHPPTRATCAVDVQRAGAPGQRVLEGVEQVPQHPREDRVVVQADQEGHSEAAQPCGKRWSVPPPVPAARLPTWHPTLLPVPQRPPALLVAHSWLRAHRGNMSAPGCVAPSTAGPGSASAWASRRASHTVLKPPCGACHRLPPSVQASPDTLRLPGRVGSTPAGTRVWAIWDSSLLLRGAGPAASPACALSSPHQHPAPPGALREPKRASRKRCAESMSRLSSRGNAATCTSPPC